jgi:hypothetical protein
LDAEQYDALRRALKMTSAEVLKRARELGLTCTAQKKGDDGETKYKLALKMDGTKTLEDLFPKEKKGPAKRK